MGIFSKFNFEGPGTQVLVVYFRVIHCSVYLPLMIFLLIYYLREETGDCPSNCRENVCVEFYFCQNKHMYFVAP